MLFGPESFPWAKPNAFAAARHRFTGTTVLAGALFPSSLFSWWLAMPAVQRVQNQRGTVLRADLDAAAEASEATKVLQARYEGAGNDAGERLERR